MDHMDIGAYRRYLEEYVREALQNSDGTNSGVAEYLREKQIGGWFVRNKHEKRQALAEARKVFDNNQHWPLEIILSHLGLNAEDLRARP